MWRTLRLSLQFAVFGFAAYAFCYLPLGERTALEHAKKLLASDAAKSAADHVVKAANELDAKVRGDVAQVEDGRPNPALAPEDSPKPDSTRESYDGPLPGAPLRRTAPNAPRDGGAVTSPQP